MIIYSLESLNDESDKTQILHLRFSWSMKQHSRVGAERPVVMLTASVHSLEWLLMQNATESMLACHSLHD